MFREKNYHVPFNTLAKKLNLHATGQIKKHD